jgi:hypothetical protein
MGEAVAGSRTIAPPGGRPGTTYARARLRLGIVCVGTFVVAAAVLLAVDAPGVLLPEASSWAWTDPAWIAVLIGLYAVVSAPFDFVGGLVLPRRHGRRTANGGFGAAWARGVVAHGAALIAVGLALLAAGRVGGDPAALLAATALMLVMLGTQVRIAGVVGDVRRVGDDRLRAGDPSFVGGVTGLPGRDRVMLSARWDGETARVQGLRREAVRRSGSRALGVALATAFTLGGMALALVVTPASATSIAGLVTLSLWMTLWSFLGLLVLPTPSRRAVVAADRAAISAGVSRAEMARVLAGLDAEQEDERRRGRLVETIFHPVPSLERRLAALGGRDAPTLPQPWHAARVALYLSWAGLVLLSRAVHCNCGRPDLWVLLPGD